MDDFTVNERQRREELRDREREGRAALEESEARFRAAAQALRDVVIRTDASLRITFVNPAWTRVLGRGAADAVGRSLGDFIDEAERDDVLAEIGEVLSGAKPEGRRSVRFVAGDATRPLDVTLPPVHGFSSRIAGLAGTISAPAEDSGVR